MRNIVLAVVAALALGAGSAGGAEHPGARIAGAGSPSAALERADAALGGAAAVPALRVAAEGPDRTLAPYFHVPGGDADADRLPLKETRAAIDVAGPIARVVVHQVFENGGTRPIEAEYVFPASTRAAVHALRMKIGARTVEARIDRRQQARAAYEQARGEGKRAALLEQERANVFTMRVANVMPRDRIEVELEYSELLVPEDATYELVYPAVVGPRYGGGADPARDRWIASPYLHAGEADPYRFGLQVHVEGGVPLQEIASPSHAITVTYPSPTSADVALAGPGGGNRDFVLRYRLAGDRVQSGLLLWPGEREGYFALVVEPPRRPTAAQIPPREFVFLLDVSGSMSGFPLETSKALMRDLLSGLRPEDAFDVVTFAGGADVLAPDGALPATVANVQRALAWLESLSGGGGTELMGGLERAYAVPRRSGAARTVVLLTDGYVGVEARAFAFVRRRLGEANLFAFGIGTSVNRALIEGVARAGLGEPAVVLRPEKAGEQAARFRRYVQTPVLSGIQLAFEGLDAREVTPSRIPDVLAERPVVVLGQYRGAAQGRIRLTGRTGEGRWERVIEVAPALAREANAPVRWLWARRWVELLEDEASLAPAQELEDAVTDLGLAHHLLTRFTSFVAIDSEVVNRGGQAVPVAQPLPMPEGVSDLAVGGMAGAKAAPVPAQLLRSMPAAALAPARREKKAAVEPRAEAEGDAASVQPEPAAVRIVVADADATATGLADRSAVVRAVEARLATARPACGAGPAEARLRLVLDAAGKVVRVETVRGDASLAACLRAALGGLLTGVRPSTAPATVELTFTLRGA